MSSSDIDARFWRLLSRVLGTPVAPGRYTPADLPQWDSLRHVELVFELEEAFGVDVPQDAIAGLFESTDHVLAFLRSRAGQG
jgi:acyl carrier protein